MNFFLTSKPIFVRIFLSREFLSAIKICRPKTKVTAEMLVFSSKSYSTDQHVASPVPLICPKPISSHRLYSSIPVQVAIGSHLEGDVFISSLDFPALPFTSIQTNLCSSVWMRACHFQTFSNLLSSKETNPKVSNVWMMNLFTSLPISWLGSSLLRNVEFQPFVSFIEDIYIYNYCFMEDCSPKSLLASLPTFSPIMSQMSLLQTVHSQHWAITIPAHSLLPLPLFS